MGHTGAIVCLSGESASEKVIILQDTKILLPLHLLIWGKQSIY